MEIRLYQPGDPVAQHIASIYHEYGLCFDKDFEDDLFAIPQMYRHGQLWVAYQDGRLVGSGAAVPDGGSRLIRRMYVASSVRRQGLAQELLNRCLGFGDFTRTHLWSDVRFREAHKLYMKNGFIPGHVRVLTDSDRSVERYFWRG